MNYMKMEFPALPENVRLARTVCAAFVLELDPTVEEMSEIKTAVSEAVTNSVIHGCPDGGTVEISAELSGRSVTYSITDNGRGIENISRAREPLYSGSGDPERSGMGFSIMEAFMDEVFVESEVNAGTTVIMKKRLIDDER